MKSCFDRLAVAVALCMALATAAQASFEGREILRRPDMCNVDMVDTVTWYAQESVRLEVEPWRCGRRVDIPQGATAAWVVCDEGGTNWIVRYDAAPTTNRCAFALAAGEGALPVDHDYTGYVSLLSGTNILGVLDRHNVAVLGQATDGGSPISPEGGAWGSLLQRMAAVEYGVNGLSHDVATNAAAIAELEDAQSALEAATNHLAAGLAGTDSRIDSLWGECVGGFRWPVYFYLDAILAGTSEGIAISEATTTNSEYNVVIETGFSRRYKGWELVPYIVRQGDFEDHIEWGDSAESPNVLPLIYSNNFVLFPEGLDWDMLDSFDDQAIAGAVNRFVTGRLGGFEKEELLEWHPRQRSTVPIFRFHGPAAGSLLAACWRTVLGAASNGVAQGKTVHLRTWPEGYGSGTNHVPAGWNTNFWAAGLGDFSCISYHTDYDRWGPGGGYQPVTMVTPRHGIVANHFKPTQGSNVWFVSRSGEVLTNRVVSYRNVRGDLTVARLERAFDTNDIAPAELLGAGWHSFLYGSTNHLGGLLGVPVLAFDCVERGYVMDWEPTALFTGRTGSVQDDRHFKLQFRKEGQNWPYFRTMAVGGDSGSPVFLPINGHMVLLGCFHTPQSGPIPTKEEVDEVIAAWGDEERVEAYNLGEGGWPNPDVPPAPIAGD